MKLIGQILPYVRKALKQNQHDQEAKELIRQIEMNAFTSSATTAAGENFSLLSNESDSHQSKAQMKNMQSKIEMLEDEL